jgi:hypothetical protein
MIAVSSIPSPTTTQLSHTDSEADTTNSDPFDPDYWTWDEAEKNYYHIDKATSEKLWYEAPPQIRLGKVLYQQFGSLTRRLVCKSGYTFVAKGTSLFPVLTFFDFGVRTEGGS